MNSKLWIRKAISSCLMIAMLATYSMVALAGTGKASGELIVTGNNFNGNAPFALVNGEAAKSGRTIFTSSMISTPDNTKAVINLGSTGEIELAPNTSLSVSFNDKNASVDLTSGSITILNSAQSVSVNVGGRAVMLNAGETATSEAGKADDDYRDSSGKCIDADKDGKEECNTGASWWLWAVVFGGAVAGVVIAATQGNNEIQLGGGATVVSPSR